MLKRLLDNWVNGQNTFSRPGEILVGAFESGRLIGIGGRNIDPYTSEARAGRLRHLYTRASSRRMGVGRAVVKTLMTDADHFFDVIALRAPDNAFAFYERLGFERVADSFYVTHHMRR